MSENKPATETSRSSSRELGNKNKTRKTEIRMKTTRTTIRNDENRKLPKTIGQNGDFAGGGGGDNGAKERNPTSLGTVRN